MKKTTRNLILFAIVTVGAGWLGLWLNRLSGGTQPPMQSLGVLVWLVLPALTGLLLRAVGGDGWKDAGLGLHLAAGWKGYVVSILVYPLAGLLTAGLAYALGRLDPQGFVDRGVGAYIAAAGVMLAGSLMKNVFEELAWRGYLTSRLEAAGVHPMINHLIVALLWMSWHLPYYFHFLDRATLESATTLSLPAFIALGYLVLIPTSVLFGELRLVSRSIWPAFLLHNVINALSTPLLIHGFVRLTGPQAFLFTPTNDGLLTALLLGVAGLFLYRIRMKSTAA